MDEKEKQFLLLMGWNEKDSLNTKEIDVS
jgi:hypothetical protein